MIDAGCDLCPKSRACNDNQYADRSEDGSASFRAGAPSRLRCVKAVGRPARGVIYFVSLVGTRSAQRCKGHVAILRDPLTDLPTVRELTYPLRVHRSAALCSGDEVPPRRRWTYGR